MSEEYALVFCDMRPSDRAFVADSWIRSYRLSRDAGRIPGEAYGPWMRTRVDRFLDTCTTIVASPSSAPSVVRGWACGRLDEETGKLLLHYVNVRSGYRGAGLARELVGVLAGSTQGSTPGTYTHRRLPYSANMERWGWQFRREA